VHLHTSDIFKNRKSLHTLVGWWLLGKASKEKEQYTYDLSNLSCKVNLEVVTRRWSPIGAYSSPHSLPQSPSFTQRSVLDIIKVPGFRRARLKQVKWIKLINTPVLLHNTQGIYCYTTIHQCLDPVFKCFRATAVQQCNVRCRLWYSLEHQCIALVLKQSNYATSRIDF